MKGLTKKQQDMVAFIGAFTESAEMAPSIYEIAEHFGVKTSTVFAHIRALQKKSVLTRSSKARSIKLTKPVRKQKLPEGAKTIPVVDDAGIPSRDLICDSKLFHRIAAGSKDLFAMQVKGTENQTFGFRDGDLVIIKTNPVSVSNGDIVLTELNGRNVFRSCRVAENGGADTNSNETEKLKGIVVGLQRSF